MTETALWGNIARLPQSRFGMCEVHFHTIYAVYTDYSAKSDAHNVAISTALVVCSLFSA